LLLVELNLDCPVWKTSQDRCNSCGELSEGNSAVGVIRHSSDNGTDALLYVVGLILLFGVEF